MPDKAFLRRQAPPNPRRLQTFAERMTRIGYDIDTSSSGALQNSLFNVKDAGIRKVGHPVSLPPILLIFFRAWKR